MRKSDRLLCVLGLLVFLLALMFPHAVFQKQRDFPVLLQMADLSEELDLTDLCLFTEARYTRHLSQSDLYSAFQDHPLSLEHFPAGSIAGPPEKGLQASDRLD